VSLAWENLQSPFGSAGAVNPEDKQVYLVDDEGQMETLEDASEIFGYPGTGGIQKVVVYLRSEGAWDAAAKESSAFYGLPREWAADPETLPCRHPRIAFRDVCRATDSRTMICALLPAGIALVEKAPYLLRRRGEEADEAYLLGVLSSLPFDWYTRRFVELKMSYGLLNAFPVPRPHEADSCRQRVIAIAGRLAAVDARYANWAEKVSVPVGSVTDEATKDDLIAELNALVAHLYGLGRSDVEHIFATFHRGWDYQSRLALVLAHYDRWAATLPGKEQR
jgi:hypothetical protein